MNKKIIFLLLISVLAMPTIVLSANSGGVTIQTIISAAVNTTLYIASGIVVILWIVTGVLFLTAQGDPGRLQSAKKALFSAVAGTLLVIAASSAINIVGQAFGLGTTS